MGSRRRKLKLVHTSDVHLHSDSSGRATYTADGRAERAFRRVIDALDRQESELFLVAGDLFDSARVADAAIEFALEQLARAPCPVVLIPGNHDVHDETSVYRRADFTQAGSHVHMLLAEEGETRELHDLHATVWGRAMVEHDQHNRPLGGIPLRSRDYWHIGMAHGHLTADRRDGFEMRSSIITHEEIGESGFDYLALGHVHVFREVSQSGTKACYSGSPGAMHLAGGREWGTVAVVTLDPETGVTIVEEKIEPGP